MKNTNVKALFLAVGALALSTQSKAAVIAVVDSGTDINHPALAGKIWNNPGEIDDGVDNDDNGYIDDLHGWNFADNDDRLVNKKLIGTFPQDDYKYFELQTKYLFGTATPTDIAWLKAKVQDQTFLAQLETFGNFVHGTHVAGVTAKNADKAQVMVLKMIGGGSSTPTLEATFEKALASAAAQHGISVQSKEKLIQLGLMLLAQAQGQALAPVGKYIANEHAQAVNCSFGTSRAEIEPVLKPLIQKILGTAYTDELMHGFSDYFINQAAASMKASFIDPAPNALFVIAAGNDGTDNDSVPAAPANAKGDNVITVAATLEREKLASFSNYGSTMVDVAAPGVGIRSSIPGDETHGGTYMTLSGTSQATPYVTNIAGQIMDANPSLSVLEVKRIIMETVDKKEWLRGKVLSGGMANPARAIRAAKLSTMTSVDAAITEANHTVADIESPVGFSGAEASQIDESLNVVRPLPNFIR